MTARPPRHGLDRRTFLALLGAGGAAAALPPLGGMLGGPWSVAGAAPSGAKASGNRYVEGMYAPVATEVTAFDLPVTGVLPPELDGRYLRNGPNPVAAVDPSRHHWFVGDGMVHGVRLRDGRAEWYRNRWVRSRAAAPVLGEQPAPGEHPDWGSWANTSVVEIAGRAFAVIEGGGRPAEMTDELGTARFSDLDGTLRHGFTAHPKRDPQTGQLHAANYWWRRQGVIDYTVVGADGRVVHQVDVPVPGNPMVHDCAITETAMVLLDLPCTLSIPAALDGWPFPYRWDPAYGARLGVLPLGGQAGEVQWFAVEPCYVFHVVNAHDEGSRVVVDVIRHSAMFATDLFGPNEGAPAVWRYVLDRATGVATEVQLDDRPLEFPRVDERVVGRPHRFSWAVEVGLGSGGDVEWPGTGLARYDAATGTTEVHRFGPGRTVGEAIFVPRSGVGGGEDDGWYLALVHDAATDRSELAVLDGRDWLGEPVATVHLPARVPLGFHGNWFPTRATDPTPPPSSTTTSTPPPSSSSSTTSTTSTTSTSVPGSSSTTTTTSSTPVGSPGAVRPAAPAAPVRATPGYTG